MRHLQRQHVRCSPSRVCERCCVRKVSSFTTCYARHPPLGAPYRFGYTDLEGHFDHGQQTAKHSLGVFFAYSNETLPIVSNSTGLRRDWGRVWDVAAPRLRVVKERRRLVMEEKVMEGCDDHAAERQPSSSGSTWQERLSHPLSALAGASPKAHEQPSGDWPFKHLPGGQAQNQPLEKQGCG